MNQKLFDKAKKHNDALIREMHETFSEQECKMIYANMFLRMAVGLTSVGISKEQIINALNLHFDELEKL
jgi:hypothetical protein